MAITRSQIARQLLQQGGVSIDERPTASLIDPRMNLSYDENRARNEIQREMGEARRGDDTGGKFRDYLTQNIGAGAAASYGNLYDNVTPEGLIDRGPFTGTYRSMKDSVIDQIYRQRQGQLAQQRYLQSEAGLRAAREKQKALDLQRNAPLVKLPSGPEGIAELDAVRNRVLAEQEAQQRADGLEDPITGKRYMSQQEAIDDLGIVLYNQRFAEGGEVSRIPFRSGDLAARDDSYGTLSGGESPASTGGDNETVFDQRFQDIVTVPETVGFTRGSDASEFIKSNLTRGLGAIARQPGISTGIDILRSIFPDTGQTFVRGVDRFGTGDEDETNRFRNRIVQPMMPMTPKLPSDIEPEQSDMQEFVQRFTLPERFQLADGGPIRQAYSLGSIVKSITKPVKKVLKSDVGKAALAAAAIYYTGGGAIGPFQRAGMSGFGFGNLPGAGLFKNAIMPGTGEALAGTSPFSKFIGSTPGRAAVGILGTSALAGALTPKQEEQVESLSSRISDQTGIDVEAIRKEVQAAYASGDLSGLRSKYPFLIPTEAAKAEGGRIGAEEGGLMNLGGNEMDLRGGGFVPLGVAEKADDVPARLSKNEFVFTADAVRAAGGGSVDRGADLMYKTMKQLENKVA
tara:strand:- start:3 stop:1886 length:1884 start_codon:yes stop_codon:yes gene_type:complete